MAKSKKVIAGLWALFVAVVAAAVGSLVIVAFSADDGGGGETNKLPAGVTLQEDFHVTTANLCGYVIGTNPIPLVYADPVKVRVDARCNNPRHRDPDKDPGAAVYSAPRQGDDVYVENVRNDTEVTLGCYTKGESVSDATGNASKIWFNIGTDESPRFLPDVNVGGGFTLDQVKALGIDLC